MTDKQKRFADEYIIDCNATRAYKAAYPSVKKEQTAAQAGSRMLRNVKVKKYIDEQLQRLSKEKIATADEVMQYLTAVMRGEESDEKQGMFDTVELRVQTKERLRAAELLAKRFGLDKTAENNAELEKLDEILKKIGGVV